MSVSGGSGQEAVAKVATEQGWWLVDADGRAVGGPFEAQVDAAIAELSCHGGSPAGADLAYGLRMDDGTVVRRFSPEDQGWLAHLASTSRPPRKVDVASPNPGYTTPEPLGRAVRWRTGSTEEGADRFAEGSSEGSQEEIRSHRHVPGGGAARPGRDQKGARQAG